MGRCSRIKHTDPHDLLGVRESADEYDDPDYDKHQEKVRRARSAKAKEAVAIVVDGSGYRADLYTLPEFGCVLWAEKK